MPAATDRLLQAHRFIELCYQISEGITPISIRDQMDSAGGPGGVGCGADGEYPAGGVGSDRTWCEDVAAGSGDHREVGQVETFDLAGRECPGEEPRGGRSGRRGWRS